MKKLTFILILLLCGGIASANYCYGSQDVLYAIVKGIQKGIYWTPAYPKPPNGIYQLQPNHTEADLGWAYLGTNVQVWITIEEATVLVWGEPAFIKGGGYCQNLFFNTQQTKDAAYFGGKVWYGYRPTIGWLFDNEDFYDEDSPEFACLSLETDFNKDCIVNQDDLAILAKDWLCDCSDPAIYESPDHNCYYGTDTNGDSIVDIIDLQLMIEQGWLN